MLFLQALACAAELSSNECDTGKREFEILQLIFNVECLFWKTNKNNLFNVGVFTLHKI